MHFLLESYEFVQKSQILQVCYNVERFLQESDNIFAKFVSICKKFLQKIRCVVSTKNSFKTFWTHFVSFLFSAHISYGKGKYLNQTGFFFTKFAKNYCLRNMKKYIHRIQLTSI